jgi:3-oxoacyl-[acyl-carrier protein] reductase
MMKLLQHKVAIVTGSSQGIGRAIAIALASEGASVVVNYHPTQQENAYLVVDTIKKNGGQAIAIAADITSLVELDYLMDATLQQFKRLDILVNNAGIMINTPLDKVGEDEFERHFNINVKGTFFACQKAAALMSHGGCIINFSSSVTAQMYPNYSVYAATKGAIDQMTRHLAKELGPKGISINAIAPGPSNTAMFTKGRSDAQLEMTRNNIAYGRLGEPEDIAAVVLTLVSEKAHWINGQTIKANGGFI